jgi:hypothetical protein
MDAMTPAYARYVKIGNLVQLCCSIRSDAIDTTGGSGAVKITGIPFECSGVGRTAGSVSYTFNFGGDYPCACQVGADYIYLRYRTSANGTLATIDVSDLKLTANGNEVTLGVTYYTES